MRTSNDFGHRVGFNSDILMTQNTGSTHNVTNHTYVPDFVRTMDQFRNKFFNVTHHTYISGFVRTMDQSGIQFSGMFGTPNTTSPFGSNGNHSVFSPSATQFLKTKAEGVVTLNPVFNCTTVAHAKMSSNGGFKFALHYSGDIYVVVYSMDAIEDLQDTRECFGLVEVTFWRVHRIKTFSRLTTDPCTASPVMEKSSIRKVRKSTGMRNATAEHIEYMATEWGVTLYPRNVPRKIGKYMVLARSSVGRC